ncbi:MAG: hypothetical protein Q9169_001634 [Polycauliona sp. 2 TL-2023]
MSPSNVHYDRIEQIIEFFLADKSPSSHKPLLISNLLDYENLTGLRLIDSGNAALKFLEEDIQTLHTSSFETPPILSLQKTSHEINHDPKIGTLLDAQSSSMLKILREDLESLHGSEFIACLSRKPVPYKRQPPTSLPCIETADLSEISRAKFLEGRVALPSPTIPLPKLPLRESEAERGPVVRSDRRLAFAPPLSNKRFVRKKRPVAADFFSHGGTTNSNPSRPIGETDSDEDITQLIGEEKANMLGNRNPISGEHSNPIDHTAVIEAGEELGSLRTKRTGSSKGASQPHRSQMTELVAKRLPTSIASTTKGRDLEDESDTRSKKRKRKSNDTDNQEQTTDLPANSSLEKLLVFWFGSRIFENKS